MRIGGKCVYIRGQLFCRKVWLGIPKVSVLGEDVKKLVCVGGANLYLGKFVSKGT